MLGESNTPSEKPRTFVLFIRKCSLHNSNLSTETAVMWRIMVLHLDCQYWVWISVTKKCRFSIICCKCKFSKKPLKKIWGNKQSLKVKHMILDAKANHSLENSSITTCSNVYSWQGRIQRFWKGGALYVGKNAWLMKKIFKITLETIIFWQNISISIFKFSPLL